MAEAVVCPRHGVETRLRCANCGKPICLRCQVRTEVGLKCQECAALPVEAVRRRRAGGMAFMGLGLVVLILATTVLLVGRAMLTARPASSTPPVGHWRSLPDLAAIRGATSAVLLKDGRVLVVGGGVGSIPIGAAEVYEPASARWTQTADLHQPRRAHGAVLLDDGRVLVAGGVAAGRVLASAEMYDPASNSWTELAPMRSPRFAHVLIALPDGHVLAAGGQGADGRPTDASEVFDPRKGEWAPAGNLLEPRSGAAAVLLKDGRVLVAGGASRSGSDPSALDTAELFDPAVAVFTRTGKMRQPRQDLTLTLLQSGQVLAVGGSSADTTTSSAEIFDPGQGSWAPTGNLHESRRLHGASRLSNGSVLVTGGEAVQTGSRSSLKSAEIYDVASGRWREAAAMSCPRSAQAQVTTRSGGVLVLAGDAAFPGEPPKAQSCVESFSAG